MWNGTFTFTSPVALLDLPFYLSVLLCMSITMATSLSVNLMWAHVCIYVCVWIHLCVYKSCLFLSVSVGECLYLCASMNLPVLSFYVYLSSCLSAYLSPYLQSILLGACIHQPPHIYMSSWLAARSIALYIRWFMSLGIFTLGTIASFCARVRVLCLSAPTLVLLFPFQSTLALWYSSWRYALNCFAAANSCKKRRR